MELFEKVPVVAIDSLPFFLYILLIILAILVILIIRKLSKIYKETRFSNDILMQLLQSQGKYFIISDKSRKSLKSLNNDKKHIFDQLIKELLPSEAIVVNDDTLEIKRKRVSELSKKDKVIYIYNEPIQ